MISPKKVVFLGLAVLAISGCAPTDGASTVADDGGDPGPVSTSSGQSESLAVEGDLVWTALDDRQIVCVMASPGLRISQKLVEDGVLASIFVNGEIYRLRMDQYPDTSAFKVSGKIGNVSRTEWFNGATAYMTAVSYGERPISVFYFVPDGQVDSDTALRLAQRTHACGKTGVRAN